MRPTQRVTGIGGVFLRGRDHEALRAWYERNLGIPLAEWGGHVFEAMPGTSTVWSIFAGDTDYWPVEQQVMVNYRVDDLDAALRHLREAGSAVAPSVDEDENYGRFAWAEDPEGNRFELWEPAPGR